MTIERNRVLEYGGPLFGGWAFNVLGIFYPALIRRYADPQQS